MVFLLQVGYFMFDAHVALHNLRRRSCCHFGVNFSVCDVIFFHPFHILAEKDNQQTVLQGSKIFIYLFSLTIERLNELHSLKTDVADINLALEQCASWMLAVSQMCCLQLFQ